MKPYLVAFVLIVVSASAQESLPPQVRAEAARLEVAMRSAEEYCREIDLFASQHPPTLLVLDSASSNWHRQQFLSDSTLASYAFVWRHADRIVAVKMWTPELGARFDPVSYCFRNNGTLARVSVAPRPSRDRDQSALRKTVAVGCQWVFHESGRRLAVAIDQQDPALLKSETTQYVYPAVHLFKHVRDLPFTEDPILDRMTKASQQFK
jgi:hypothetical protein